MANVKFTEFPSAATVGSTDIIPIVQGGLNKKATVAVFTTYFGSLFATLTGTQTLTNKTLTSPKINQILDSNGNEILAFTPITSAVDYISIKNGIGVGVPVHISATGDSTNIGLHLEPKGSGLIQISDGTDTTKGIRFRSSGSATSAVTLIDAVSSAGRVITLPNATGTLALTTQIPSVSGTTNYLPKFTGASALGNSQLFDNGNVGIGNAAPFYSLDLTGQTNRTARIYSASADTRLYIQNTTSGNPTTDAGLLIGLIENDTFFYNYQAGNTIFGTNSAERMRITSAGNVGIGTTTPADKLTISGATGYTGISIDTGNPTGGAYLAIKQNGVSSGFFGGSGAALGDTSSDLALYAETSKGIRFYTNGSASERMRIFSDGNIAINSASNAGYKLDVNGTTRLNGVVTLLAEDWHKSTDGKQRLYFATNSTTYLKGSDIEFRNNSDTSLLQLASGGTATFSGKVNIGNPVTAAVAVASTHKVEIVIGGTTYYLLATT